MPIRWEEGMGGSVPRRRLVSRGELLAVAGAIALAVVAATLGVAAGEPPAECHLDFEPAEVTAGGEALEVTSIPSEDIEPPDAVTVDPASGLVVTLFGDRPFELIVNPADAAVGDWFVTVLRGEEELCRGPLTVTSPARTNGGG